MLPLIIKDYNWSQTVDMIYLKVHVKGIRAAKTSFVTADNYIRLYYPPYYFEVFLWGEIDEVNSKCTLNENESLVVFELPKKLVETCKSNNDSSNEKDQKEVGNGDGKKSESKSQLVEWPQLELTDINKAEKNEIRVRAVDMSQKRAQDEIAALQKQRQEQKQMTIQEQIRIDDEARKRIAEIKSFETKCFMDEIEGWKEEVTNLNAEVVKTATAFRKSIDPAADYESSKVAITEHGDLLEHLGAGSESKDTGSSLNDDTLQNDGSSSQIWSSMELLNINKEKFPKPTTIVPIRKGGSVQFQFTPREFPTPSRESTALIEEEWLTKQMEVRKNCGFSDENLQPEERNPNWLLEKGQSLMETGSYLGAANAFTSGLKLAPKFPQLFVGRAQAQLALSNYIKTVEDASQAIELLTPKVNQNLKDRLASHCCRGEAFRKLQMYQEAIEDYREALRLDPDNKELRKTYAAVQQEELNAVDSDKE